MRLLLFLLLVVSSALAQGMPSSPSRVDSWSSPHNQKRLRMQWEVLPPFKPTKLPDGSEEPPKAPWPMLIYVKDQDSKASEKLDEDVFGDARMVIASHAVKFIQLKPEKAIDVPWLRTVTGIKDPTLLLVDRDFKVVDVMNSPKEFSNSGKVLKAMDKVVKDTYETSLTSYVGAYFKLLKDGESLWKQEQKMEELRKKAADADKAKAEKYDKEADEIEADLKPAMSALADEEVAIQDSLVLKGSGVKEETPTTFGTGKERRKLTPAEIEALEAFKEFSRDQNPVVRAAAVEDLGAIDSAVMVDAILKAANDVDLRVIQAAGKGLGRMKSEESLSAMLAGLTDSNSKARHAALLGFAHLTKPYPAAMKPVSDMLRSSRDDEVRKAAIQALETMGDAKAAPELVEALDDSEESLRVMAATALGNLKATSAAPALIERVGASDWSLQKACIEALAKIRVKESIEPLLKAFEKEEGLLQEVLYKALVAITGQDFKYIAKNWRTWWDKYGSGFVVPTEAEIEEARKKAEKALEGYYDPRGKRKYHKIETLSRKMVFVIDISASMSDKIVIPPYAPEEIQQEFPERVKIEIAKKELIDLLAELEPNVYFNIITFAGRVKTWQDNLVPGSMRTAAIKYVSKLKAMEPPRGGRKASSGEEQKTNTYGALMAAFGLQDEAIPNWKARTQVDTIFFVTDGVPTTGEITDVPKLINTVSDMNKGRGVIIHVIVFDKQEAVKLGPLATKNGGQVVVRGYVPDG